MPEKFECNECKKKFDSSESLKQHMHSKHSIKIEKPVERNIRISKKKLIFYGIVLFSVVVIIALVVFNPNNNSSLIGLPISENISRQLSSVSFDTLNSVGKGASSNLNQIAGDTLTENGKPVVLYMGADYCPYCASERWSMIVALSKFGSFDGLTYMASSSLDAFASTPTFSFSEMSYKSDYISFQAVEMNDRDGAPLQTPTPQQRTIMQRYDNSGSIPFVDIANRYILVGSQVQPSVIQRMSWDEIASKLDNPTNAVSKNINGAANVLIGAICKATENKPSDVCSQPFAK